MLFVLNSALQAEHLKLRVIKADAFLRLNHSTESEVIETFPTGAVLESTGKVEGWYRVELMSEKGILILGYIQEEFVEVLEVIKEEPEAEPEEISEQPPPPLAEFHLRELAVRAKSKRTWRGVEDIAYGSIFGGLGIIIHNVAEGDPEGEKIGNYFMIFGALEVLTGVWDLSVRSSVEKEYDAAMMLSAFEREQACAAVLASEANKGKVGRLINGATGSGIAVIFMAVQPITYRGFGGEDDTFNWNYVCAGIGAIMAVSSFMGRSIEETHYQQYLLEKEDYERRSKIGFNFGFVPKGIVITLTCDF